MTEQTTQQATAALFKARQDHAAVRLEMRVNEALRQRDEQLAQAHAEVQAAKDAA